MAQSKHAMARDKNEPEIIKALRKVGAKVRQIKEGGGIPDLLVGHLGALYLLEVKDGNKVPSAQKLTKDQVKFFEEWAGYPVRKVNSVESALKAIGAIKGD